MLGGKGNGGVEGVRDYREAKGEERHLGEILLQIVSRQVGHEMAVSMAYVGVRSTALICWDNRGLAFD